MINKPVVLYSNNFLKYAAALAEPLPDGFSKVFDNNRANIFRYGQSSTLAVDFAVKSYDGKDERRRFNTLILKNHNLDAVEVFAQRPNGEWAEAFCAGNLNGEDVIYTAPITAESGGIRVVFTAVAGQSAVCIGAFGVLERFLDLFALTETELTPARGANSFRTYDGSVVHWTKYRKKDFKVKISNCSKPQFDEIYARVQDTQELFVSLWEDYDVLDAYECYVNPEFKFSCSRRTGLIDFDLECEEL